MGQRLRAMHAQEKHRAPTGELREQFELLASAGLRTPELVQILGTVQQRLSQGELRLVDQVDGAWRLNGWLKRALMLMAQMSQPVMQPEPWGGTQLELAPWAEVPNTRALIPFGCHVRASAFVADGVVLTPPSVVQAGAYIGAGSLVDAHVLVGNCARVGRGVVLQAGTVIAGHLHPLDALPNIVEDSCQCGGGSGLYDGVVLGMGSILLPGTVVSARVGVFDPGQGLWLHADLAGTLHVPPLSVLGMGSLPVGTPGSGVQRSVPLVLGTRQGVNSLEIIYADAARYASNGPS